VTFKKTTWTKAWSFIATQEINIKIMSLEFILTNFGDVNHVASALSHRAGRGFADNSNHRVRPKGLYIMAVAAISLMSANLPATTAEMRSFKSLSDAVKAAESIPVKIEVGGTTNVAQRMKAAGITITGGRSYSYDSKRELEEPTDMVGDVHLTIEGTQPPEPFKRGTCDMWGDASFLKRGGRFYPESRSANWLMTGACSTKFLKP
jgi:hypothetical protein